MKHISEMPLEGTESRYSHHSKTADASRTRAPTGDTSDVGRMEDVKKGSCRLHASGAGCLSHNGKGSIYPIITR